MAKPSCKPPWLTSLANLPSPNPPGLTSYGDSQVTELRQRNRKLKQGLHDRRVLRKELQGELLQAESQWSQVAADRQQLQAEVHAMRHSLEASSLHCDSPCSRCADAEHRLHLPCVPCVYIAQCPKVYGLSCLCMVCHVCVRPAIFAYGLPSLCMVCHAGVWPAILVYGLTMYCG